MIMYPNTVLPHHYRCSCDPEIEMRPVWCEKCCNPDRAFALYRKLKNAYYDGHPFVSDAQFDNYETLCRRMWPDDLRFHQAGVIDE